MNIDRQFACSPGIHRKDGNKYSGIQVIMIIFGAGARTMQKGGGAGGGVIPSKHGRENGSR